MEHYPLDRCSVGVLFWICLWLQVCRLADSRESGNQKAKENKLGVYSPECYQREENLETPECIIKGNIDLSNKSLKRYYFPGCAQYEFVLVEKDKGEDWFCTEKQAQSAGYTKAKSCYEQQFKYNP